MNLKKMGIVALVIALIGAIVGGAIWYFSVTLPKGTRDAMTKKGHAFEGNTTKRPLSTGIFVLTDDIKNNGGIYGAFTSVGYDVLSGNFEKYEKEKDYKGVFVFPEEYTNKLTGEQINTIKKNIENGQNAIITGKSKLSEAIGIEFKYEKKVNSYIMKGHEKQKIEIENGMPSYQFTAPKGFESLAVNASDKTDILVTGNIGNGKVIYSASPLAPKNGSGFEYYPFLMEAFSREFKLTPVFSRNNGAIYVDIGYHMGIETAAQLTEKAKAWGYDQINLGVWGINKNTESYYREILDEAHKRGIKVFAWFELPMVSVDFWEQHPEWRQKTADGKDAHIDWRYLMALENPDCFAAAKKIVKNTMLNYDFDGMDIAEIYYESPGKGFTDASIFTPMNDSFREDFKKKHGFDPKEIFNSSSEYYWNKNADAKKKIVDERVNYITQQHREMLDLANEIKKEKPYIQTNITMIDSVSDDRMRENIGVDAKEIVDLQKKYGFILEIEDPFTLWSLGPERYQVIGEGYRKIMDKKDKLYIDINIIDRYGQNYPTKKQRGLEVYSLIHNASKYTDKVIMYSLSTLEKEDMVLAPYAYAYDVTGRELSSGVYEFESKNNFTWHVDLKGKTVLVDGVEYPVYADESIIVPGGKHKVEIKDGEYLGIRINDINSKIILANVENGETTIKYDSHGRCFITVNKKPTSIIVDGKEVKPEMKELNGNYVLMLESGEHTLNIK